MAADAGMLAGLFERSMGLGGAWEVSDVWFAGDPEGGDGELHLRVRRRPGAALPCPECGRGCGACDTRERVWRHLDIWQYRTYVHCEVPRPGCPEHGPRTARVPRGSEPSPHLAALSGAQVVAMALSGLTVRGIAGLLGEHDTRLRGLLGAAVGRARGEADHSGVAAVGVDETARRRGQDYLTSFVDVDRGRVPCVAEGRSHETVAEFAADLAAHGGDPAAVGAAACDLSQAFAKGVAESLPGAVRVADKSRAARLLAAATGRVRAAEAKESAENARLPRGTGRVWLKNRGSLTEGQRERKLAISRPRMKTGRACAMKECMQDIYACGDRETARPLPDALSRRVRRSNIPQTGEVGRSLVINREEILAWFDHRKTNAMPGGSTRSPGRSRGRPGASGTSSTSRPSYTLGSASCRSTCH